ncbi:MAG: hypothetical protein ACI80V_002857 [Rhodothermales bacterium]|jgi:hypothetical protein
MRIAGQLSAWALLAFLMAPQVAAQQGLSGELGLEARGFARSAAFPGQDDHAVSVSLSPEWFTEWADRRQRLVISPFFRLDAGDQDRSTVDLREAYWQWIGRDFELRTGVAQVFWGVTESQHLVDIINQTDAVARPDGEAKLGQPMVQGTWVAPSFTLDVFVLPLFRERTFPGVNGRLRFPQSVAKGDAIRHERVDVAARVFGTIRSLDLGLTGFWGTSREPIIRASAAGLAWKYPEIRQVGLDAQLTKGLWLLKSEMIVRGGLGSTFFATASGFEYTIGNFRQTGADIGLLAEYHYDGRDPILLGESEFWATTFRDDVFAGVRVAMNDVQSTELLGGAIVDRKTGETAAFLEASRRFGSRFVANLELRAFKWTDPTGPLDALSRDDYLQLGVAYYF